jgi:threonine aldolase
MTGSSTPGSSTPGSGTPGSSTPADTPSVADRRRAAQPEVTRHLGAGAQSSPAQVLAELAEETARLGEAGRWDRYGTHGPVGELERRVAELLGKPAAAMFPSGVMAQQSVLRCWTDRQGSTRVALPGLSHLLHHEQDGPALLHGLRYEHLTDAARTATVEDLDAVKGPLGAVLLELPLRDGGYLLPTWEELVDLSRACRVRGVPLHLDGARLWESAPYWGRELHEVAALADSVYVSFYKGLRGLAGAVVAGPADVVDEARQWRTRMGGTLFSLHPYAVAGLRGLRLELPRMAEYHDRATELAKLLLDRGIRVFPEPPHTNAFRIHVPRPAAEVDERVVTLMETERLALTPPFTDADVPGWAWTELTVGAVTMEWDPEEAADRLAHTLLG